jgi:hypothetical protein
VGPPPPEPGGPPPRTALAVGAVDRPGLLRTVDRDVTWAALVF